MIILSAKFTFYDNTEYNVLLNNMLSLEGSLTDRKDYTLPSWGVISNGGNIRFVDYDGSIHSFLSNLDFNKETKVDLYLENTASGFKTKTGDYFVESWSYDDDNKNVTAKLYDGLTKMQDIPITPIKKDAKNGGTKTAKELYQNLRAQTVANGFDIVSFDELDYATQAHLTNLTIYLAYIEDKNLWGAWNDLCIVAQLYMLKNSIGKIVCNYKEGE